MMKKLLLTAAMVLVVSSCTDKECWKCELTSAQPVITSYVITDKYVDCSVDIDRMTQHWLDRGRTGKVKCTNLESGEVIVKTKED